MYLLYYLHIIHYTFPKEFQYLIYQLIHHTNLYNSFVIHPKIP